MHILFISAPEIFVVLFLALVFFGAKAIPDIARMLGKGMREFKKASDEIKREFDESTSDLKRDINDVQKSLEKQARDLNDDFSKIDDN
ncbi:MAG: twin-arginine translocase TatA/TatE family subunit [Prolixibacteraceae bacterium]|nr:twin-arginine translocase TatA/TatE family subunit [Prolixibacteraceae bacterium]